MFTISSFLTLFTLETTKEGFLSSYTKNRLFLNSQQRYKFQNRTFIKTNI